MASEMSGRIFNIQRCCSGDGPGIRTVVFLQGCPLHCLWCHNPESQCFQPLVSFRAEACINCGKCVKFEPDRQCRRNPENSCSGCGICVKECPADALTLQGETVPVSTVMKTVVRDKFYYEQSGGGMTLSGGEPLAQKEFSAALLKAAKAENIHTAVETSGALPWQNIQPLLPYCDLWLFDIKAVSTRYKELTGADHTLVKENLLRLLSAGKPVILRIPLVMGANCEDEFLDELKELSRLPGVEKVDILPYHDFGQGKSTMCGKAEPEWEKFSTPPPEIIELYRRTLDRQ